MVAHGQRLHVLGGHAKSAVSCSFCRIHSLPTSHPQYMGLCHVSESNHSERDQPVHQPVHIQVSQRSDDHHDTHKGQHT